MSPGRSHGLAQTCLSLWAAEIQTTGRLDKRMYGAEIATVAQELGGEGEWAQGGQRQLCGEGRLPLAAFVERLGRKGPCEKGTAWENLRGEVRGGRRKNAEDTC